MQQRITPTLLGILLLVLALVVAGGCTFDLGFRPVEDGPVSGEDGSGSGDHTMPDDGFVPAENPPHEFGVEQLPEQRTYDNGTGTVYVDSADERQQIDGFGASNAWLTPPTDSGIRANIVRLLFSRRYGIGLSILRTRVPFRENPGDYQDGFVQHDGPDSYAYTVNGDGAKTFALNWNSWELSNTRTLIGAIDDLPYGPGDLVVMSTPWTPPNRWKTSYRGAGYTYDPVDYPAYGGTLDPSHNADYADILADYALGFEANMGVPLRALSIQNEPNFIPLNNGSPAYESSWWTGEQIRDFLPTLRARFDLKNVPDSVKVVAAEGTGMDESMVDASLADADAAAALDIVGVHQYDNETPWHNGTDPAANLGAELLPDADAAGKRIWMTEASWGGPNSDAPPDFLDWAKMIHFDLTIGEINAFIYWWLWSENPTQGALITLTDDGYLANRRMFAMGQYSRFVRPGWKRVGSTTEPTSGVYTSAFRNPHRSEMAVVLINDRAGDETVTIDVDRVSAFSSIRAWRTSDGEELAPIDAPSSSGASATVELPSRSVTTVYFEVQ